MEERKAPWAGAAWVATSMVCLGALLAVVTRPVRPHHAPIQPRFAAVPEETVTGGRSEAPQADARPPSPETENAAAIEGRPGDE